MRSAFAVAAFAANVLAAPYQKRDEVVVTDVDVVYATDVVTVTADSVETSTAAADNDHQWAHSWGSWEPGSNPWWPKSSMAAPTTPTSTYVAPVPTSTYVPPPPPTSTYVPPPPPTTTYVPPPAPTTTSTTEAAPTTWAAPTTEAAPAPSGDVATGTTATGAPITWTSSAAYTGYSDVVVLHHNFHRNNHSAPLLTWNDTLAKSAQDLANTCNYHHDTDMDGGGYGQNIAAGVDMNNVTAVITDLFYNGEVGWFDGLYGQAQPDMTNFEHWGHFSQIVWSSTTSVACATSNCTSQGLQGVGSDTDAYFTVCNYFPAGNFANEYGSNIGDSNNYPTVPWDAS